MDTEQDRMTRPTDVPIVQSAGPAYAELAQAFAEAIRQETTAPFTVAKARAVQNLAKSALGALAAQGVQNARDFVCTEESMDAQVGSMSFTASETFGSKMVRELSAILPDLMRVQRQSPEQLVLAIAMARREGLTDVADALERQLLGRQTDGTKPVEARSVVKARPLIIPDNAPAEFADDDPNSPGEVS